MRPVRQTRYAVPETADDETLPFAVWGDCFEACLASVLEVPRSEVPDRDGSPADADGLREYASQTAWLAARGLRLAYTRPSVVPVGFAIASGPKASGRGHSVVVHDGRVVHNPTTDPAPLVGVWDYAVPVPVSAPGVTAWRVRPAAALPPLDDHLWDEEVSA